MKTFAEYIENMDGQATVAYRPGSTQTPVPANRGSAQTQSPGSTGRDPNHPAGSIEEFEHQARMTGKLPKGWDGYNDFQKQIQFLFIKGNRPQTTVTSR